MKKEIKKIAAVAMALAMTVGSSIPAFAAKSIVMDGTVQDTNINMDLPTDGILTIRPYAGTQIDSGVYYFNNKNVKDTDTEGFANITYNVSVPKYLAVVNTPANPKDPKIALAEEIGDDVGTSKVMAPRIQIGTPFNVEDADAENAVLGATAGTLATRDAVETSGSSAEATTEEALAFSRGFGKAVVDIPVSTAAVVKTANATATNSSIAYTTDTKDYTVVTDVTEAKIGPGQAAGFRITGSVNTNADWEPGVDGIAIVPVFNITVTVATNPIK